MPLHCSYLRCASEDIEIPWGKGSQGHQGLQASLLQGAVLRGCWAGSEGTRQPWQGFRGAGVCSSGDMQAPVPLCREEGAREGSTHPARWSYSDADSQVRWKSSLIPSSLLRRWCVCCWRTETHRLSYPKNPAPRCTALAACFSKGVSERSEFPGPFLRDPVCLSWKWLLQLMYLEESA